MAKPKPKPKRKTPAKHGDMGPPELRRHGLVVEEPVDRSERGTVLQLRARRLTALEELHRRGAITDEQRAAGERLRNAWELGVEGAQDHDTVPLGGLAAWQKCAMTEGRLAAATDYRLALEAVGKRMSPILNWVCCRGRTLREWAAISESRIEGASAVLRLALDTLADHYARSKRPAKRPID